MDALSFSSPQLVQRCRQCLIELPPGALECSQCHSLVHAEELDRLAASANDLEAKGRLRPARDAWLHALALLPPKCQQADWIRLHSRQLLSRAMDAEAPETENKWVKKLGPLGPIAVVLAKSKALLVAVFKLKFLLSFAAFFAFYWALYGMKFGLGFAVVILVHEMGHFIEVKRRGLPAEMPVFLPGFGAYVRWQALGVTAETRAFVSLAGPFVGWIASVVCVLVWLKTGNALWSALARAGAWLNVLNLIPVWVLDGGQTANAMSRTDRIVLLTACLGLWLFLGESVFFLVAAGAAWRVFTKDLPPHPSRVVTACYLVILVCLGVVLRFLPGQGFSTQ